MRNMTVAVVLAAFTAVSSQAQEYARLYDLTIDGDSVHVSPDIARTGGAGVTICLRNASAWNKGIGRAGGRWFQADPSGVVCINDIRAAPGQALDFYKAKTFGVMTKVQTLTFNFTGWEGHQITYVWDGN